MLAFITYKAYAIYAIYECSTIEVSSSDGGSWSSRTSCVIVGYAGVDRDIKENDQYRYLAEKSYRIGSNPVSKETAIKHCHYGSNNLLTRCNSIVAYGQANPTMCQKYTETADKNLCLVAALGDDVGANICETQKKTRDEFCSNL